MKILFISHKYPPSTGGMEVQSYELISGIEKKHTIVKLVIKPKESQLTFFLTFRKKLNQILTTHKDIDIIHLNDGLMASVYYLLCPRIPIKTIITIHGLEITFPLYIYQKHLVPRLHACNGVICVSEATRQE